MEVNLTFITPIAVCDQAIAKCWNKPKKELDRNRMAIVVNDNRYESVVEHIVASFEILGISRLTLQELAEHRTASLSVKSTHYTLKDDLKDENPFISYIDGACEITEGDYIRASKYVCLTGAHAIDVAVIKNLDNVRALVIDGLPVDKVKYALGEAYKTDLQYTINLSALKNLLTLRTRPSVHFEIRELANKFFECIPEEYRFLLENAIWKEPISNGDGCDQ